MKKWFSGSTGCTEAFEEEEDFDGDADDALEDLAGADAAAMGGLAGEDCMEEGGFEEDDVCEDGRLEREGADVKLSFRNGNRGRNRKLRVWFSCEG